MPLGIGSIFLRKLQSIGVLNDEDRSAISALPLRVMDLRADQDIVREGDRTSRSCILLSGMACWFKMTGSKRQILSFQIPGDLPDMESIYLDTLDSTLATMTACKVAFIPHESLRALSISHPRVGAAFWRSTLIDSAIYREWVANVGARPASARIAHILCEMVIRLAAVDLATDNSCDLPITQAELADAAGLSAVQVNRSVKELRSKGLISLRGTSLNVLDWPGLQAAGDFDAAYLHLKSRH